MEDPESILGSAKSTAEAAPLPPEGLGGDSAAPIDGEWQPFHGPECDSCATLGNLTHSGESFLTKLSLHGSAEIHHHAILVLHEFTEIITENRFITDLSSMDSESVGRFLANYRNCLLRHGYKILYDDCQPFYEVSSIEFDNSDGHTITGFRELHSNPDLTLVSDNSMEDFHVSNIGISVPDPNPTRDAESVGGFNENYCNICVPDGCRTLSNCYQQICDVPSTQVYNSDGNTILELRERHSIPNISVVGNKTKDVFQPADTRPNEPDSSPNKEVELKYAESVGGFLQNNRNFQPLYNVPLTQRENFSDRLQVRELHSTTDIALMGDKSLNYFHPRKDAESVGGYFAKRRTYCVPHGNEIMQNDCHPLSYFPFNQVDNSYGNTSHPNDCQPLYAVPIIQSNTSDGHTVALARKFHSTPEIGHMANRAMEVFHVTNTAPSKPGGGLLANYRNSHANDGYNVIYNNHQPLYNVPFAQVANANGRSTVKVREYNSTPDIALVGAKSMNAFHNTTTRPDKYYPNFIRAPQLEAYQIGQSNYITSRHYNNEMHQYHGIMCAEGPSKLGEDGGERFPSFSIACQRERIMHMTVRDISPYFCLPMKKAAKKLHICPSALKKLCRRLRIDRWPYRRVSSDKKWNVDLKITNKAKYSTQPTNGHSARASHQLNPTYAFNQKKYNKQVY